MKILAIGDPHGNLEKIRKIPMKWIDLILMTGDIGKADLARQRHFENLQRKKEGLPEIKENAEYKKAVYNQVHNSTIDILRYLSRNFPVYTLIGNVGIYSDAEARKASEKIGLKLKSTTGEIRRLSNVHLYKNRLKTSDGLRIGFLEYFTDTSWVREFKPKDYDKSMKRAKRQTEKAKRILERFGKNLDILVCHQPPYRFLDKVNFPGVPDGWKGKHAGSKVILNYIKKYQPRYVFCGHIHEGEGMKKIGKTEVYNLGVAGHKIVNF
jgi:Icc-related predicted phosphoesterase